ncbi:CHAT domain-containing protein [Actinoplanes sp. HUAS TT8]|uniref:CHAT domain-containing protein n=1 Tax=Actinoplanes sp. HUAS TT8 TaxID=3447453 RepID=UPI003F529102
MTGSAAGYRQLGHLIAGAPVASTPAEEPIVPSARPDPQGAAVSEARTLGEQDVDLAGSLPPHCALLIVESADHAAPVRHFRLKFILGGQTRESTDRGVQEQEVPDFSLVRIVERQAWQDDFYALRAWWADLHELEDWLADLLAHDDSGRADPSTRLVVWDSTDHQIPWELCYAHQPRDGGRRGWLGELIEVVRWTTVHAPGRRNHYTGVQRTTSGRVLLLETDQITEDEADIAVAPLVDDRGVRPERTLTGLVGQLGPGHPDAALVLINCHGVDATDAQSFSLAELSMNKLDAYDMPALASPGAVVLLNACNTAKLVPVSPASYHATKSFAELFLRKGAVSVIATLGRISLLHTYTFTEKLLYDEERRIAALLLDHRRRYANLVAVPGAGTRPADFENFFYGFMYVCFGHPDTILDLTGEAT